MGKKKKKDNLRRGKRGTVPRFDYHVLFSGETNDQHKFITNVKDVLFLGWDHRFKLDSHVLNKYILRDGKAVFKRRDGSEMVVLRTQKHTPEELVEMYLSSDEEKMNYVDNYLAINPGLRRKVSPLVKQESKNQAKLRPAKDKEEARDEMTTVELSELNLI
ncbi:MAG: hypothetical protein ACPGJS_14160 [Flammeovirgaceae bacterium]